MAEIRWNSTKSARLKRQRGVSFEEIVRAKLLGIREHPRRNEQQILIFEHKGYIWAVPFVIDDEGDFLKNNISQP